MEDSKLNEKCSAFRDFVETFGCYTSTSWSKYRKYMIYILLEEEDETFEIIHKLVKPFLNISQNMFFMHLVICYTSSLEIALKIAEKIPLKNLPTIKNKGTEWKVCIKKISNKRELKNFINDKLIFK